MNEETVMYMCPVCNTVNYAQAEDVLVTCENGHHLSIGSLPDENGCVTAEVIGDEDDEE